MGGRQIPEQGPNTDGYSEEGYDETQRAQILEATRRGPTDGGVQNDLDPDLGGDGYDDKDSLKLRDSDLTAAERDVRRDKKDIREDELQTDFEDGTSDGDTLNASEDDALNP